MKTVVTHVCFMLMFRSVSNQSRKRLNTGIMKLVLIDQHQKVHVILALITELRHVNGNDVSVIEIQHVHRYLRILLLELANGRQRTTEVLVSECHPYSTYACMACTVIDICGHDDHI